jgi:outer membrane protein OmpA-like peptidoglycan-associated protein
MYLGMGDEPRFLRTRRKRHAAAAAHGGEPRAQVCVVDALLCEAKADPDDQAPELTGFYQEKTGGRPRYTLQVNQAGDHVRLWVRQVLHGGFGPKDHLSRRWRYFGRRDRGKSAFRLFADAYNWDFADGKLEGTPESLKFTGSGITGDSLPELVFERCEGEAAKRPVYADRIRQEMEADGSEAARRVAYQEFYRLPSYDVARIDRAATSPALKALIDAFLDQPRQVQGDFALKTWAAWNQCILNLDNYVAQELFHRQPRKAAGRIGAGAPEGLPGDGSPESWHASDEEAVAARVIHRLRYEAHKHGGKGRSVLGWLAHALELRANSRLNPNGWPAYEDFVAIKKLLKIPDPGQSAATPIKYTFRFSALQGEAKAAFGVRGFIGTVAISQGKDDPDRYDFFIAAGVLGPAVGVGAGVFPDSVEVESYAQWEQHDFAGWLEYLEAGAEGGAGIASAEAKVGAIVVHGSGRHLPLVLDLTGAGPKTPGFEKPNFKVGAGASGALGPGYLWGKGQRGLRYSRAAVDTPPILIDYVNKLSERQKVHFFEGDSRLTPWGRQVLGMFCAEELRALRSPGCVLSIYGYTDPEGSAQSNAALSEHRAANTLQCLWDIAGTIGAKLEKLEGMGELPAKLEGRVRDGAEDPQWRRVNVILDTHVLLELHVPRRP